MQATVTTCPIDDDVASEAWGEYNGYPLRSCQKYKLVFTEQRQFPDDLYEQVYAGPAYKEMLEVAEKTHKGELGFEALWWYKKMALKWMDRLEVPKTLLDVGCGPGTFLMVAQERGWDVHGIELAREAGA